VERPLSLEEFDDRHQKSEMVYAVAQDHVNKRITLVFRGTENKLAKKSNWFANLSIFKAQAQVPEVLKGVLQKGMAIHSGFFNYVFNPTKDEMDDSEFRKYDEILADIKPLLKKNPSYKLYVTGHSLGAALSTVVSFYLACEPDLPKPVTCINFASPRVGDHNFLEATRWLEKENLLRMMRVV
jgi:predicted lipase